ncbi:MAG: GNAT family N-acetyltransferase [Betaproteobacteria bacterium]
MHVVCVTDRSGRITEPEWLSRAEVVHRQLRPQLPQEYASRLSEVFAGGGRLAVVVEAAQVVCVALWRVIENTYEGRRLYVDDLVSDENRRSSGAGKIMLDWLEGEAKRLDCDVLALDSGVQRQRAHHFYFREGMHIPSFCFRKALK